MFALAYLLSALVAGTPKDDGSDLLDKARAALGGVEAMRSVGSFSAAGSVETTWAGRSRKTDVELHFLLPDRFLRKEKVRTDRRREATLLIVLNGNDAWMDVNPRPPRGDIMGERLNFSEGPEPIDVGFAKAEFGRLALGLLLTLPSSLDARFTRGADLEVASRPATIVNVSAGTGLDVSLYLARETGWPIKLDYLGWTPPVPEAGPGRIPSWVSIPSTISIPLRGGFGRIAIPTSMGWASALEPGDIPAEVIVQERFSEYRSVSRIQVPHRITRLADQQIFEELKLNRVVIDPALDAAIFERPR